MRKESEYKEFTLRFAHEAGKQMRILFDKIESLRLRAKTAEAQLDMAARRLGDCHTGNLLQRIDILREQERCLSLLVASVGDKADSVTYLCPDDAYDLTEILVQCHLALDSNVN